MKIVLRHIPFNKPVLMGNEIRYIMDAVKRRSHMSGDGYYDRVCSKWFEKKLHAKRVLLTPSCTQALELAALILNIAPGDEVILPSYTFPSTANAFLLRGAKLVFADIRRDTFNLNEHTLEPYITKKTKVIVPVHYAGVPCEMDVILRLAKKYRLAVVEDAAQALGATYKGRPAGAMGVLNAFSFHETKNAHCGEGGALVIQDKAYGLRAEIIRQKGTNRNQFLRGQVDKYSWVDMGSSYLPSELQAAYLYAQLEKFSTIQARRQKLYETYCDALLTFEKQGKFRLPITPKHCRSSHHLFHLLFESEKERDRVMQGLQACGITAIFHYIPLHLSPMGKKLGYSSGSLPVTESVYRRILRLPVYNDMTQTEQSYVIRSLTQLIA